MEGMANTLWHTATMETLGRNISRKLQRPWNVLQACNCTSCVIPRPLTDSLNRTKFRLSLRENILSKRAGTPSSMHHQYPLSPALCRLDCRLWASVLFLAVSDGEILWCYQAYGQVEVKA